MGVYLGDRHLELRRKTVSLNLNDVSTFEKKLNRIEISVEFLAVFVAVTICGYASLYYDYSRIDNHAFTLTVGELRLDVVESVYFSLVTFATVGYGDIAPKATLARALVSCEIVTSLTTLIFLIWSYSLSPAYVPPQEPGA